MDILSIEHLTKVYGTGPAAVRALDDVSLTIAAGEFVAIVGSSGSGKSTLMHLMGGVDRPTSGTVRMNGEDVYKRTDEQLAVFRRREVGLVYQFYNLIPVLDVEENVTLPVRMDGRKVNEQRLRALLSSLGLKGFEHHLPNQLSGGQQQRVAIGRALMNSPAIVLADEPTGNLDSKNSAEIMRLLRSSNRDLHQRGNHARRGRGPHGSARHCHRGRPRGLRRAQGVSAMGVFASFTLRSLRKNRTRTVVTVIGVILSTALLTGVVATATSVASALLGRTIETEGSWQVYDELQPAEADSALGRLATDANVAAAMDSQAAGFASYASDADLSTTLLAIQTAPRVLRGGADQARGLAVMPTVRSGREPEAPGEVMLPATFSGVTLTDDGSGASAASDGPIELGSTVTLPLGATLGDGDSPGTPTTTRSFTVVGFYTPQHFARNDFSAFEEVGTTAIVSPNDVSSPIFTRVWVDTSGFSTRDALKGWAAPIFGEENYYLHGRLLSLQGMASDESATMDSLRGMVAVIGGVIVVAAIGMIGNSFSISVAERTRQFGLLSSLGASRRQLRRTVLLEAAAIGLVGIPVGLAAGLAGVAAMLSSSARAFDAMLRSSLSGTAQGIPLVISPAVVAGMAAASFLVLLASAWAPAWRAGRVSAIDAIRQQQDVRLSKPRKPLLERIAGLPGLLASRNLSRSSSRGRTVVVSLALSVVLIVLSGAISLYMGRSMDLVDDLGPTNRSTTLGPPTDPTCHLPSTTARKPIKAPCPRARWAWRETRRPYPTRWTVSPRVRPS